jgi:tRNA (adenine37-N6)-methyltransferase
MDPIEPIGILQSPHNSIANMPILPKGASEIVGQVIVNEAYADGLRDLTGFSHVYLLYRFHKAKRTELVVTPFMDNQPRSVF